MAQPWVAEKPVSADLARSLIEAQFPALAPVRAEPFGAGWDNTAFLVNGAYVFRFPRRQLVVPQLATEARLLPVVAPRLPLPIPVPIFAGRPADGYAWPFAGYALLPGRTACVADLDESHRTAAAEPLARFLAALHAVPAAEAARHGAGPDAIARLDVARRLPQLRETFDRFLACGLIEDVRPFTPLLDAAAAPYAPRGNTLVHGDLYVRHLLIDDHLRLAGVIDWGDIHLGDPAADLMIAHSFLPPAAHASFRRAYGSISERAWEMGRLRALWHTAMVLNYGRETGDADLVREGLRGLGYLARA